MWIPAEGIREDVIRSYTQRHLGPEAYAINGKGYGVDAVGDFDAYAELSY
jgi:hypothetical protein